MFNNPSKVAWAKDSDGGILEANGGSLSTITHDHRQIHQGSGFTHSQLHSAVVSGASHTHMISVGANPIHIRSFAIQISGAPVNVAYRKDVITSADGTLLGIGNNNFNSALVSTTQIFEGPTITDTGDLIGESLLPSITNQGGNSLDIITGGEWILKPNTKYTYTITNNNNSAIDYTVTIFFYEPALS
jgi:hypothetical protein